MNNRARQLFVVSFFLCSHFAFSQSAKEIFSNSGIWQDYGIPVNALQYPEFKGRLVNINWADIEVSPNVWNWAEFDNDIEDHIADGLPVIFMVYTGGNAPTWLYANGVTKVNQTRNGESIGYTPYYLDSDYDYYFKRMITTVRQHVETLDPSIRNKIIGVQACFGSTGDQIGYKGDVAPQYAITNDQVDSLFKVYSAYYYNEYKNISPKITMLSNPSYQKPDQQQWLDANCPGGWTKCGTMAKGSQLNMESDKNDWLYDILNKPSSGYYVKARSEILGDQLFSGWWTKNQYKEMFATLSYCIYWGIDWPNETASILQDPKFDSSFHFFNKYAGQKIAGLAQNAVCILKDALDASDTDRFPESIYGALSQTNVTRYKNIYNNFSSYGAKLEDPSAATGNEYNCLGAKGTNDVGWHLLKGNYERFIHQIDANVTSAGYWNVDSEHPDVMYGRYARGFDLSKGKDALYFDIQDDFLNNKPLKGLYPVTIDVTYYDQGFGSWQLYYDGVGKTNQATHDITCTNTGTWKKASFVITDAHFRNRGDRGSDFYIKNTGNQNVIFSVVEISRQPQNAANFITSSIVNFDTVCQNADVTPKSFVLNAASLNGDKVKIGPMTGFNFSTRPDSDFTSELFLSNYGSAINTVIYVKPVTKDTGNFTGRVIIKGGGLPNARLKMISYVQNSSPVLDAKVTPISCYNSKDAAIELNPKGGVGPFTYYWTNDQHYYWNDTTKAISGLNVANYTVEVKSVWGCSISKTFNITQPDKLVASVSEDSAIICRGGTTTVSVSGMGGTTPYSGTGTFVVPSGFHSYLVTDAHGCTDNQGYTVQGGTIPTPNKPGGISGPKVATSFEQNLNYYINTPNSQFSYRWTVPSDATIVSGQNTSSIIVNWGTMTGSVSAVAYTICGESPEISKMVAVSNSNAFGTNITGTVSLLPNPVKDVATIVFNTDSNVPFTLEVTDLSGKSLLVKKGRSLIGINRELFSVQRLASGSYYITLVINATQKKTMLLVKQ